MFQLSFKIIFNHYNSPYHAKKTTLTFTTTAVGELLSYDCSFTRIYTRPAIGTR